MHFRVYATDPIVKVGVVKIGSFVNLTVLRKNLAVRV